MKKIIKKYLYTFTGNNNNTASLNKGRLSNAIQAPLSCALILGQLTWNSERVGSQTWLSPSFLSQAELENKQTMARSNADLTRTPGLADSVQFSLWPESQQELGLWTEVPCRTFSNLMINAPNEPINELNFSITLVQNESFNYNFFLNLNVLCFW